MVDMCFDALNYMYNHNATNPTNTSMKLPRWTIVRTQSSLHTMMSTGIAHRDIKGANCLVGNDGVIKLADAIMKDRMNELFN